MKSKTCLKTRKTLVVFPPESNLLDKIVPYIGSTVHGTISFIIIILPAPDVPPDRVGDSDESLHDLSGRDYR